MYVVACGVEESLLLGLLGDLESKVLVFVCPGDKVPEVLLLAL